MSWFIGILTLFLVVDCLFLILLVMVQLPKKEAGMGQAFGGAATDALFGAGSGNALTKVTKYATVIFFVLTMGVSVLYGVHNRRKGGDPRLNLSAADLAAPLPGVVAKSNTAAASVTAATTGTNAPVEKAGTNAVAPANAAPATAPATSTPAK